VILRISSIAIPKAGIDNYLDHVERDLIPRYQTASGLESISILQRVVVAYVEVITISAWQSQDALTHFFATWPADMKHECAGIEFEPHTYTLLMSRQGQRRDQNAE
jgi:hypothetical protein